MQGISQIQNQGFQYIQHGSQPTGHPSNTMQILAHQPIQYQVVPSAQQINQQFFPQSIQNQWIQNQSTQNQSIQNQVLQNQMLQNQMLQNQMLQNQSTGFPVNAAQS